MQAIRGRSVLAAVFCAGLSACGTSEGLGEVVGIYGRSWAAPATMPDGASGWTVGCTNRFENSVSQCYDRAKALCPAGYRLYQQRNTVSQVPQAAMPDAPPDELAEAERTIQIACLN